MGYMHSRPSLDDDKVPAKATRKLRPTRDIKPAKATKVVRKAGAREKQFDYTSVLATLKPNRVLHFVDDGQDFLRWYLAPNGVVVCSEPYQTAQWAGIVVVDAKVGEFPSIITADGKRTKVLHAVKRIVKLKQAKR